MSISQTPCVSSVVDSVSIFTLLPQFVQVLGSVTIQATTATPSKRYANVLTLNTAGSNLLLFSCPSTSALISWAAALRLASWEKSRLEEIYTAHIIRIFIGSKQPFHSFVFVPGIYIYVSVFLEQLEIRRPPSFVVKWRVGQGSVSQVKRIGSVFGYRCKKAQKAMINLYLLTHPLRMLQ